MIDDGSLDEVCQDSEIKVEDMRAHYQVHHQSEIFMTFCPWPKCCYVVYGEPNAIKANFTKGHGMVGPAMRLMEEQPVFVKILKNTWYKAPTLTRYPPIVPAKLPDRGGEKWT